MRRRGFLAAAAAMALAGRLKAETGDDMIGQARALARSPYRRPAARMAPPFDALNYDSYRGIRPRPGGGADIALGGGLRAMLLPPGWLFADPVEVLPPGATEPLTPDAAMFDYDPRYFTAPPGRIGDGTGFSGLRILGPLNRPDRDDEILVMQGASYFRALARGLVYGLSARALALGTGGPQPEEFPAFRRIALHRPENGRLRLAALVDSPRAAAAFLVDLAPGDETAMDCELVLFPRVDIADAGIAPLTSMFFFGPMGPGFADDFRPAVHDSDVLWMHNGAGERLWRPLANPAAVQMSGFADNAPRAFGLLQTARGFGDFRDAAGAYHRRPDAWVEPLGDWGPGAVHLLEIPTIDEYADNIAAFWRPAGVLAGGGEYRFAYRLVWAGAPPPDDLPLRPARSMSGVEPLHRQGRLFVIDFAGRADPAMLSLHAEVQGGTGQISGETLYPLPETGEIRASFVFEPAPGATVAELRVSLRHRAGSQPAAPVWLHRWTPARDGGV